MYEKFYYGVWYKVKNPCDWLNQSVLNQVLCEVFRTVILKPKTMSAESFISSVEFCPVEFKDGGVTAMYIRSGFQVERVEALSIRGSVNELIRKRTPHGYHHLLGDFTVLFGRNDREFFEVTCDSVGDTDTTQQPESDTRIDDLLKRGKEIKDRLGALDSEKDLLYSELIKIKGEIVEFQKRMNSKIDNLFGV